MIKFDVEEGNAQIQHQGDPIMVGAEIAMAIGGVYQAYKTKDAFAAEIFRAAVVKSLEFDSPAWTPTEGATTVVIPVDKKSGGAPTGQS